jgi:NitT/TauT family transport system permease protein
LSSDETLRGSVAAELIELDAAEQVRPSRVRSGVTRLRSVLELLIVPAVLLIIWALVARHVGSEAAATPLQTLRAIIDGFQEGWLGPALRKTLVGALVAFVVAAAIGLPLGFALGLNRFWGKVLEGPLLWLYAIPKIVLFPIFLLLLGLTFKSRVAFAVAHGFIPLALFTMGGVRSVRPVHLKVAKVYRLSWLRTALRIVVPSALPAIAVGLRYCFSLCFLGLVVAEMFASKEGTGYVLVQAINLHFVPRLFAIATVLAVIALVVNMLLLKVENLARRRWAEGR